jgi:hypothetical protein
MIVTRVTLPLQAGCYLDPAERRGGGWERAMRQTTMDRWIEVAEARRVSQIAQEGWAEPPAPTWPPDSVLTRLRSMVMNPNFTSGPGSRRATQSDA